VSRAGEKLLSKVIDMKDPNAIKRFNIKPYHFTTQVEKDALKFIEDYADKQRGEVPDYVTLVEETGLNYEPTSDSYEYLVEQAKDFSLRTRTLDWLQGEVGPSFQTNKVNSHEFLENIVDEAKQLLHEHNNRAKVGTDLVRDVETFLSEYQKRKAGESFTTWRSRFESVNEEIGGYASGSLYTWYGRSGRGKSAVTLAEVIHAAEQGATVLIWAMEMSTYEVLARAYSVLSAGQGVFSTKHNGIDLDAGFSNKGILMGDLGDEFEEGFETFLKQLNSVIDGKIIVRGVDDEDFIKRGLRELEEDIIATKADVVLVDPFYYLDYEKNVDGTTGGAAGQTSQKIRHMAGRTKTVVHAITQAEETSEEMDEAGVRELRAPRRGEVKKTSALLEDASLVIGVDTLAKDGEGVVSLSKGRNGGEGTEIDLIYLPNYGIIQESPSGEAIADALADDF
jgi:replicative DNA helicase